MCMLEGISNVANFIIAYEESHFLIRGVFLVSKGNTFDIYYNDPMIHHQA